MSDIQTADIRVPRPDEFDAIGSVVTTAFGEHGAEVATLVRELRSLWDRGRGYELVAVAGDEVVGHVGFTRGYLDCLDRLRHVLVLSPLAVHPKAERRGLGAALVRAGLDAAAKQGHDLVFLEGAPLLYPKVGFVEGGRAGFDKPSDRIPDRAFQVYFLTDGGRSLSGRLVYPEVFWENDCVGLRGERLQGALAAE